MLFKSIKSKFVEKFNDAKPENAGAFAPRVGNYFIKDLEFKEIGIRGQVPIALVHWNTNSSNTFFNDVEFSIALSGLNFPIPEDYNNLVGGIISITDSKVNFVFENNATKKVLSYNCKKVNQYPSFINLATAALQDFQQASDNLYDACKSFALNAPYDVAEAEYWEAMGEVIVEEISDDIDLENEITA